MGVFVEVEGWGVDDAAGFVGFDVDGLWSIRRVASGCSSQCLLSFFSDEMTQSWPRYCIENQRSA